MIYYTWRQIMTGIYYMVIVGCLFVVMALVMLLMQTEVFLSTIIAGIGVLILVIAMVISERKEK
jgi:hypothetical protein